MIFAKFKNRQNCWVWCHRTIVPALGRLVWKDHKFEARLGCMVRTRLKKKEKEQAKLVDSDKSQNSSYL
jgi:hypothetical protein